MLIAFAKALQNFQSNSVSVDQMRRAIIVDIDGTLLHSAKQDDRIYRRAVTRVLGKVNLRSSLGDYSQITDTGILRQIVEDNRHEFSEKLLADVKAEFVGGIARHIEEHGAFEALPGARRFIDRLRESPQAGIAIATGGWRESARLKLATAGFDTTGVPFATSDDAIERVDIMRIALDSLDGPFDDVTYYGDGQWDRTASLALGWRFRAVGPELEGIESFDSEPAF